MRPAASTSTPSTSTRPARGRAFVENDDPQALRLSDGGEPPSSKSLLTLIDALEKERLALRKEGDERPPRHRR